jgi:hypothetical protein
MAADGAAELGQLVDEVVDALAGLRPNDDQGPEGGRRRGRERPGGFESLQSTAAGRPVACTLPAAAQLLGVPLPRVRQAAATLAPYTHQDGSPRWSVAELERALGCKRGGAGSAWRGRGGTVARARPPAT